MVSLGAALVGGAASCTDDGTEQTSSDGTGPGDGTTSVGPSTATDPDPDDSGGCIPGSSGCSCLDGTCQGSLECVENVCVNGPLIEVGEGRSAMAGVVLPMEATVEAEEWSWSQASGPMVEILGADGLQIEVVIPPDAPAGETVTLTLTAMRNGVTAEADVDIEILGDGFEDFLAGITDPTELGSTEGLDFDPNGMWVVSSEGFVSLFDPEGAFVQRYDVGGSPVGARFMGEQLLVANIDGTGSVQTLNSVSGNLGVLFDTYDGMPVGTVNFPLPDNDGNVYVSTRLDQRVLYYDMEAGSASLLLENPGLVNPNAMTFGPEGNAIYIGTVGHVWRVPLIDGGGAGEPEDYLDLGDDTGITYEVDGLAFDEGNNLWVGCPNASTLFLARYSEMGPTEVIRSWVDPAPGISRFVNLRFGNGDFGRQWLYWTNLGDGSVGRVRVGLERGNSPLGN